MVLGVTADRESTAHDILENNQDDEIIYKGSMFHLYCLRPFPYPLLSKAQGRAIQTNHAFNHLLVILLNFGRATDLKTPTVHYETMPTLIPVDCK